MLKLSLILQPSVNKVVHVDNPRLGGRETTLTGDESLLLFSTLTGDESLLLFSTLTGMRSLLCSCFKQRGGLFSAPAVTGMMTLLFFSSTRDDDSSPLYPRDEVSFLPTG